MITLTLAKFMIGHFIAMGTLWAAPCCSGSALVPQIITTDSNAQISLRTSYNATIGTSDSNGRARFYRDGNDESAMSWALTGAYALSPRWQWHGEVPLNRRMRQIDASQSSHFGVGDVSTGVTFEALEELRYSVIKPRIWVFADVTAPTGRSVFDSKDRLASDVHGRGFWAFTGGAFALKTWQRWDASMLLEVRRELSESGRTGGATYVGELAAGHHWGDFRSGLSVGPTWEVNPSASTKLWWSVGAQAGYAWREVWSASLSYTDQTILGPTYNATLGRALALLLSRRFE